MACEKCWGDAYLRWMSDPAKSQAEHYADLLQERKNSLCTPEEEAGQEPAAPRQSIISDEIPYRGPCAASAFGTGAATRPARTSYYRSEWSSIVGIGVFRKCADQSNDLLIVTVVLPKDAAEALADEIVGLLDDEEASDGK